ncbi:LacI family DNA-binding transcriptional regulator [Aquirufa ecclesiirivi]|uniref:LacI family DNA-binding transcriptional regulator n=1 Tax=Aquirufa ecclesiirivi TaxID=2715124 RepID=UPI00140B73FE|nr:LacI family DNA-binding transcriptional regulator [Aquirufa ecclesiirivi]MCZ2471922.1 LacI family transcriptional regulator [Aquirufa ecclesiirivi]NHC49978.1 LacI family transcriptional regulator [Aquirufa ecclesiirivi]
MRHQVTIKDIAKQLNVSVATVSRALRDLPDIHPDTKKLVLDLAKEWDYQPNLLATSLVKSKTKTLGLIVPDLGYYFFSTVIKHIEEAAIKAGYSLLITQTQESYERELTNIQNLSRGQVDGIIISLSRETSNFEHLTRLQRRGIPLVFFDRNCEEIEASKVMVDNEQSAYEAVKHLIENGCKRIAFLAGPKNVSVSNQRRLGYIHALEEAGLSVDPSLILHSDYYQDTARSQTHLLMQSDNRPDGILVVSDRLAIGVLTALKELKISVPKDVKIVSFNNEPICQVISPTITSVSQPLDEIGRISVELLLAQIEHKTGESIPRIEVLKTNLVVRESSTQLN